MARDNWLFSCSIEGAEPAAILFTLVETAKAYQAHPYYYLKYLPEIFPGQKAGKTNSFLYDCMPGSDAYRTYASDEKKICDSLRTSVQLNDPGYPAEKKGVHKAVAL